MRSASNWYQINNNNNNNNNNDNNNNDDNNNNNNNSNSNDDDNNNNKNNNKALGHDGVQGFWKKRLDKMHEGIATQLNEILEGTIEIPRWMTYGRTVLCKKDPVKGNSVEKLRPITCLPLIWKLLTGIISEDMYCFMENENLLPEEQ